MRGPMDQRAFMVLGGVLTVVLGAWMLVGVAELPTTGPGLTPTVEAAMPDSGVEHPVTAVLLNFRGYDTWLELGVLLLAAFGVLLTQPSNDLAQVRRWASDGPLLERSMGLLLPLAVVVAGYLLWVGKYAAGGAFQAGVVLGSALVLVWLSGSVRVVVLPALWFRLTLVIGFVAFLGVGVGTLVTGAAFLQYPSASAGNWILLIEACATVSIAWTMVTLILAQPMETRNSGVTR